MYERSLNRYECEKQLSCRASVGTAVVDRVGAGDSYLAVSSLCMAAKLPLEIAVFLGSIAAAIDVQIIGNKQPVKKANLLKYLTRLMK